MSNIDHIKAILDSTLNLGGRALTFTRETPLLGELPELDSMAVVMVLTGIEERFGIVIEDDEVSAETFETVGSLADFVDAKLGNA
jgi:acyl carrier protein